MLCVYRSNNDRIEDQRLHPDTEQEHDLLSD